MLKRMLHAANQVVTHQKDIQGYPLKIEDTVNGKFDILRIGGDSWQLQQEARKDADGNILQAAIPSPEEPSEITSLKQGDTLQSNGWNLYKGGDIEAVYYTSISVDLKAGRTYVFLADVESDDTDSNSCLIHSEEGFKSKTIKRGQGQAVIISMDKDIRNLRLYASYSGKTSVGDSFSIQNIQISEVQRPYDRYRGNQITLPCDLHAIRDTNGDIVAQDFLNIDRKNKRVWVERWTYSMVLDGSKDEQWYKSVDYKGFLCLYIFEDAYEFRCGICTQLKVMSYRDIAVKNAIYIGMCNNCAYLQNISFYDENLSDYGLANWKAHLKESPIEIVTYHDEPIIEELPWNDGYLLDTCQYETNVRFTDINPELKPILKGKVKVLGR